MTSLSKILLLSVMVVVVGFTVLQTELASGKSAEDAALSGETEMQSPANNSFSQIKYKDMGSMVASWYGPGFHGRYTANGEVYDEMALTAAHKTLNFGTLLRLTNLKNGKSILVRINDRGPYIPGRHIDLSKGSAIALGALNKGVINLKVEEVSINEDSPIVALQ